MVRIVGTQGNDSLFGTPDDDLILGSGGHDVLHGVGGSDTLDGGLGADTFNGGQGLDFVEYINSAAVIVNLETGTAAGGHAFGDVFNSIEGILGSTQNDLLIGNARDNVILGRDGRDVILGGEGRDELAGGEGNDNIDGGNGADTIRGGPGADRLDAGVSGSEDDVSFQFAASGVTVDLTTGRGTRGEALGDTYRNFDGIIGSRHDDHLIGDDNANFIRSEAGIDTMEGRGGDDSLIGSGILSGGEGNDGLFGAGTLNGNQGDDVLAGSDGNDTINGGLGNDSISAVRGADVLRGGNGEDVFIFVGGDSTVALGQDRILDFARGEDTLNLRSIDAIQGNMSLNDEFDFIGRNAFTGTAGELRFFVSLANNATFVQTDENGDGVADLQVILEGQIELTAADFLL